MTELLPNIFAIEVAIFCKKAIIKDQKVHVYDEEDIELRGPYDLPPGSYEILFTTKGVTKAQATDILPKIERKNEPVYYQYHGDEDALGTTDWEAALQSLLKSKGLTAANFLIIKRVEG